MPAKIKINNKKDEWMNQVNELCNLIQKWVEEKGWFVHKEERLIDEEKFGTYTLPFLFIQTPQGRITVEPIGHDIIGADGRIDICSFPTFIRMILLRKNNKWILKTDSLVNWPEQWNKNTFFNVIEALTAA